MLEYLNLNSCYREEKTRADEYSQRIVDIENRLHEFVEANTSFREANDKLREDLECVGWHPFRVVLSVVVDTLNKAVIARMTP